MSTYGTNPAYGFKHGLYLNTNKNDDDIHVEIVALSEDLGKQNIVKAEKIILSETPPPRLSDNPTFHKCQYCAAKDVCHTGALVNRNCRSCKFAKPVENAEFFCTIHNGIIPRDFVITTCDSYSSINDD
ncbi:Cas4-domain exonuclease [Klebsiella phage vB_KmiS-Kmi2C]|nr:Cas4-domain exonuclease [Klebsiella phage vB_KmiS-Kmi2C]